MPIKPPERLRDREPTPDLLRSSVQKAKARALGRRHAPILTLDRSEDGPAKWSWPFGETSEGARDWRWLVLDAFGTRHEAIAGCFVESLLYLCAAEWDEARQEWIPNEGELAVMLGIINAHQPRNEAQAALAAQMAATHLLTMKVARRVADYPHDTRTINAFAKLAQASAVQFEAMAAVKGRRRSTRQDIRVSRESHVHHHQHVHVTGGAVHGAEQPQEARKSLDVEKSGAVLAGECTALPSPDEARNRMPGERRKGKARVP